MQPISSVQTTTHDLANGISSLLYCSSRNLYSIAGSLQVDDFLENAPSDVASAFLRVLAPVLAKDSAPSRSAIIVLGDSEKMCMVMHGVWKPVSFLEILALGLNELINVLVISRDFVASEDWLKQYAGSLILGIDEHGIAHVCPARMEIVANAYLRTCGVHALPLEYLADVFGNHLSTIVEFDPRLCRMASGVLEATMLLTSHSTAPSIASRAFAKVCHAHPSKLFRAGDVRDALATFAAREARSRGSAFRLICEEDILSLGLADVRALATTSVARAQIVHELVSRGMTFRFTSLSVFLKQKVIGLVGHGGVRVGGGEDVAQACANVGRPWVKPLLSALGTSAVRALASLPVDAIARVLEATRVSDREWVQKRLHDAL